MLKIKAKMLRRVLFFLFSMVTAAFAQTTNSNLSPGNEKIYIHFDKPYYTAGETAWFKAYVYQERLPYEHSIDFHLQLEDENGRIVDSKKYPIAGAIVNGSINLPDSLQEGYYRLKAVTKTMVLNDPEFLYTKSLFVMNPMQRQKDSTHKKKKVALQFFPESGHLIDRIKTQVAFKATDENGNPVELNGVIKTDSAGVISSFKTYHNGIGKFSFTPRIAEKFYAVVEFNGVAQRFSLPAVRPSGVYLKVSSVDSGKVFEITRSKQDQDFFDTVRLVVRMNHDTVYENLIPFGYEQSLTGLLKTKNIPSGILHFIVLNKNAVPMAERLCFVNNREYISNPELVEIKRDSSRRGENNFEIRFRDSVQHSFSVSVTDAEVQDFSDKENIYSRLLLTSDLRGYVYDPGYYFEKDDVATRLALDNLMLTHGWTRYNWERKKPVPASSKAPDHYLILMSGTVKDTKTGEPVAGGALHLQLVAEDSSVQSFDITINTNGTFKQDSLLFFGESKLYYSFISATGKSSSVTLQLDENKDDSIFLHLPGRKELNLANEKIDSIFYEQAMMMPLARFESKYKLLGAVSVKTRAKRVSDKVNEKYASVIYSTSGKLVLDNINFPYNNPSSSVLDYILNNIRTVYLDRADNQVVNRKNFSLQNAKNWKVELLVDETVSTVTNVRSLTVGNVALIKFYEAGFVGVGTGAPGGAVAIYLKKGADAGPLAVNDSEKYISYNGYSVTQEFYHPDYSLPAPEHTAPDQRLTLYWNGFVQPANAGKHTRFRFFNNDFSKKICITIEGFNAQGKLIHVVKNESID